MKNTTYRPVHISYSDTFNMAVPLIECSIQEQRSVIRFLWSEGTKSNEMYGTMIVQFGGNCASSMDENIRRKDERCRC
jgi:hypothetical protein